MKLYRTTTGIFVQVKEEFFILEEEMWDRIICSDQLFVEAQRATTGTPVCADQIGTILAPIVSQEVWAAGSTYCRKQEACTEECGAGGGGDSYDRIRNAERPQLFFKSAGRRVANPGGAVRIRSDARRSIPEPELTLVINPRGRIVGYTAGNDMSACDIERENPLYLPQAKIYDGSCAIGPCVLLATNPLCPETGIAIDIERSGNLAFRGLASLAGLKRKPEHLVEYLFRDNSFTDGVYLMTGTPLVFPESFTLAKGDTIRITIEGVGTLENYVA